MIATKYKVAKYKGEIVSHLKSTIGIGSNNIEKLRKLGIETTSELLKKGALPDDRRRIAQAINVKTFQVLEWIVCCDFLRIKGMKCAYLDLLNACGISTVQDIAMYKPKELYAKLVSVNNARMIVTRLPSREQVKSWISQVKQLPAIIWFDGMFCCGIGQS